MLRRYNFKHMTIPQVSSKAPKPKALLVSYADQDKTIVKGQLAQKERYEREGYEVETINIRIDPVTKKPNQEDIKKLKSGIERVKKSPPQTGLISFLHHGSEPPSEREHIFEPEYTAQILLDNGLCTNDLEQMLIRYNPCFGSKIRRGIRSRAERFFQTLHDGGAGNFIGDAKNTINTTLNEYQAPINLEDQVKDIEEIKLELSDIKNLKEKANKEELLYLEQKEDELNQELIFLQNSSEYYLQATDRGDSISELKDSSLSEDFMIRKPPRLINSKGIFEYTTFFVADKKDPVKKTNIHVINTIDRLVLLSSRIKNILNHITKKGTTTGQKRI